MIEITYVLTI